MTVLEIAEKVKEKYNLESRDEEIENLKEEISTIKDCIREYDEILSNITKLIDMLGKNVYNDNKNY